MALSRAALAARHGTVLLLLAAAPVQARSQVLQPAAKAPAATGWSTAGRQGDFIMRDFRFADGATLPELRIHYTTLGSPQRNSAGLVTNAVLILHGTGGTGRGFLSPSFAGELFAPGELLDSATHFIVLPDGIGAGGSSKPSDGLRSSFPHYRYADMVTAQYRLLTEQLGVNHLLLVMGTSMGAMHSWMWAERYPDFMDGVVPLASVPTEIAGRNRMIRRMAMDDIRQDPQYKNGEYTSTPPGLRGALQLLYIMSSAPLVQHREAPTRDSADAVINRFLDARMRNT